MTFYSPTTVLVGALLLYLFSFVVFAIIRIGTGVSIQRIGYFSLRRIAYAPKDGIQIDLRGLGLSLHRPTFAQPTWISLRLEDLKVTVDPSVLGKNGKGKRSKPEVSESGNSSEDLDGKNASGASSKSRSKTWKTLTQVKDRVKRLHRQIHWLAMVDVIAVNTTLQFKEAGYVQIGSFSMAVDTRRKTVDRGKPFRHKKDPSGEQRPAEWMMNVRNVLLAVDGREPMEVLDNIGVNIHGLLYKDLDGLRDTSVAVKVGRLHVPYDDLMMLSQKMKKLKQSFSKGEANGTDDERSFADFVEELDRPGSRDDAIVQTIAESKEFMSSLLRGIQEIQVALSFFRMSRSLESLSADQKSMCLNVVTHEIGVDLHRMDPKSPAHRMYFRRNDIAHQALLAAISLSVSLDDSSGETDKILYIPMATTTIKTTLPSKTLSFSDEHDIEERNTNVLFANLVVTSPSIDLEPQHVSRLLGVAQSRASSRVKRRGKGRLFSRLLPKANIKLSIHEPVLRFILPISEDSNAEPDEYNLLISSVSSMSLDIEAAHSTEGKDHYGLSSMYRIASHQLYYQTPAGVKYNLLKTETMEAQIHLNASPEVCLIASGNLNSCSIHMVNTDVIRGIRQVVEQFRKHVRPKRLSMSLEEHKPSVLRRLPPWLLRFQFEASDISIEVAGVDPGVSKITRGVALQLQSWKADYRAQKPEPTRQVVRRRTPSHSTVGEDLSFRFPPTSPPKKSHQGLADGRRLALHVRGLEGFAIESEDYMEPESFFSLPRFEVALSTQSDLQGPIFHINSVIKGVYLHFSLYRYYSLGIAMTVLQDAFMRSPPGERRQSVSDAKLRGLTGSPLQGRRAPPSKTELITVDVRATIIQVKAQLPTDPPMMLQIYGLAAGRHRWSGPFVRCHLVRLHAEAPKLKGVWARVVSMNNVRLDLREIKRQQASGLVEERSIDVWTDFIRIGVPHHMIMHHIFDNIVNTAKALQQLNHRFKTRSNEYVLEKHPEAPKKVPKVALRSRALLFELEDDAFEWKLSSIYRAGLVEQRQRLAREEAFRLKAQKIKEADQRRAPSRFRAQSSHPHPHSGRKSEDKAERRRSQSADRRPRRGSSESRGRRGRKYRYDTEGSSCLSSNAKISEQEAWYRLQEHNARSWKAKIDAALRFQDSSMKEIRNLFSGADEPPEDVEDDEPVLSIPNRPGLMSALISDVYLVLDKPTFPLSDYAQYLHAIGKGMPLDMKYSLLIPMSIQLEMGEARVNLRDYPLDLLHIPALRPGQSPRLPSWSLRTNFVIAEELRDERSVRHVRVEVTPPSQLPDGSTNSAFAIDVRRTVSPVKTYCDPVFEINTSLPTSISWGMSYQPVIQDMMKIIEGFTKPEIDPSEKVGFWDKIRLSFHSRINVFWKGDGDVHLRLKGSRDPYVVTGFGAGFVMCWRKDVKLGIHTSDDPREFMSVSSGEYVLAIPDYSHEARYTFESPLDDSESSSTDSDTRNTALFKKVVTKLSGNVRWLAGLVFERDVDGTRSSDFRPHYDIVLRNPKYIDPSEANDYDAFRGFRSDHIHLSVAVVAPDSRDWSVDKGPSSASYNAVHLTPRFFTHFFDWWSLFSGVMSLPVRQGPLWPGVTKTAKKFGRHLATVKYKVLFAPLFIAHIYKHKDPEDYGEDVVTATGVKVRLDSFKLDIHQRREQIRTQAKAPSKQTQSSTMRINEAQLDFQAADFRAVSASIEGTNPEDIQKNTDDIISSFQQPVASVDISRFNIPDRNLDWIDMDDFVELDWILPQESNPRTQILPLAFTPRFTYFRQTDHGEVDPDQTGYSPFGHEPTHECVMSQDNDPRRVQMELVKARLATLEAQIEEYARTIGEQNQAIDEESEDSDAMAKYELLLRQAESLGRRHSFLMAGLRRLERQLSGEESLSDANRERPDSDTQSRIGDNNESTGGSQDPEIDGLYASPNDEFASDFTNRFIIHNIQLKWNNSLRNIILRYGHQVSQRRGFVYYMSRRAVKFILDIVEEQNKSKRRNSELFRGSSPSPSNDEGSTQQDDGESVEDRIEQLLNDAKRYVDADDPGSPGSGGNKDKKTRPLSTDFTENIAPEFTPLNSYHLRLIAPQIQLQSMKNQKSVALIAAKGMQLKVVSIMDKNRVWDDVSGLVQRRFSLEMDGAQFFVATQKNLMAHLQFYAGNKYGNPPGSAWPPWISMEAMFDFELNPFGFSRIIQKTSASLRYDKYNNLRLKYNEEVDKEEPSEVHAHEGRETRMDQIWVDFPHVRAICDSDEYYSMYIIVLDLLLYSEPLEKVRNERLEKIMLASDFSDLRGAPEMVNKLQEHIRQLEEIKEHFQVQAKYLDRKGWEDRMSLERDLTKCEDELFFIMKAITTAQRRNEERSTAQANGILRWNITASEVVWHLMKDQSEPLVEFQLRNAAYERTDNSDGSNHNLMEVERLYGLNLLPNAIYPQMIVPYVEQSRRVEAQDDHMLKVKWYMLEAVAGIPVLDDFEVTLIPLKIQLERELGQKLFEYIFPGVGANAFENGGFSPFMIRHMKPMGEGDSDEEDTPESDQAQQSTGSASGDESQNSKGPGSIELRLQPTLSLPDQKKSVQRANRLKGLAMTPIKDSNQLEPPDDTRSIRPATAGGPLKKKSLESLRVLARTTTDKSLTNVSGGSSSAASEEKGKKFTLGKNKNAKADKNDDLSQMMSRASNYMTLAHVRINDVVLCLSYKGRGERNIGDVHDFVFRLPVLEYRNKTWSNLDLALRLKKDVIKALISHAPAILGNKFSHHRPTKQQQKKLRELASSSQVLPSSESVLNVSLADPPRSLASRDSSSDVSESPSRRSFNSGTSPLGRSNSLDSSIPGSLNPSIRSFQEPSIVISDSHSASEIDVDAGSEHSRLGSTLSRRPTLERPSTAGADEDDENHSRKTFRSFGRRFLGTRN
ncbi:hypothetical protein VTN00DRAFT_3978 [Thermoascus crustaceus]|uniref:uncharacterized protein n=1 Tax=Thermoascus crustaceus TaxID=5088 RepID=UPI00374332FF